MDELLERMQLRLVHDADPVVVQQLPRFGLKFFDLRDGVFGHCPASLGFPVPASKFKVVGCRLLVVSGKYLPAA